MENKNKLTIETQSAISLYGIENCLEAYRQHRLGNGASTISYMVLGSRFEGATHGNRAIDAGREISLRSN